MDFFRESEHGGDINGFRERYDREPLDFSVNVNPLGTPESVKRAAAEALELAWQYPDPHQRALTQALAEHHGLGNNQILVGAGASDVIYRVIFSERPGRAVITGPTFSEYERALRAAGSEVSCFLLREEDEFLLNGRMDELLALAEHDPKFGSGNSSDSEGSERSFRSGWDDETGGLNQHGDRAGMILLCEPNNPTGRTTDREELLYLLSECRKRGIILVVDESFQGLLDDPDGHTLVPFGKDYPNLVILRSFTKLFAMPGIRLGYGIFFSEEMRARAEACGASWPVSAGAEAAGLAAMGESEYVEEYRRQNSREREFLRRELLSVDGIDFVSDAEANYLLIHADRPLAEPLAENGILVRDCGNYHGLDGNWIRVCVKGRSENERLLAALRPLCQGKEAK